MSEEKKNVELNDDELDLVAGGYSEEEWAGMTVEERKAAQSASIIAKMQNRPCALE